MYSRDELFLRSLEQALKQFVTRVHTLFSIYFQQITFERNTNKNKSNTSDDLHLIKLVTNQDGNWPKCDSPLTSLDVYIDNL